jgi:predicted Zn-dependent peptidase
MDKGLNAEELGKAKTAKIGEFPLRFEYPGNWARSAISDLFYGRDLGYTPKSRERIARIDLPQVNEAMRRTLDPETMALVIVGDPAQLQGQLSGLEEFEVRKEKDDWY